MNKKAMVRIYIFENDIRRNVFKILDTSFEGLCLKTPNTTFGRGCVTPFKTSRVY